MAQILYISTMKRQEIELIESLENLLQNERMEKSVAFSENYTFRIFVVGTLPLRFVK